MGTTGFSPCSPSALYHRLSRRVSSILKVRDLTPHTGSSRFVYRLLVRPQIPHVGDVNLVEVEDTQKVLPGF